MTPFKKNSLHAFETRVSCNKKNVILPWYYGFTLFSSYDLYQACCCLHLWNIPKFRNGQGSSLTRTAHQMFQLSVPQWLKHRSTTCTARRVARSIPNRQEIPPDSPRMPWTPCTQQGGYIKVCTVEIKKIEPWHIKQCLHVCICIKTMTTSENNEKYTVNGKPFCNNATRWSSNIFWSTCTLLRCKLLIDVMLCARNKVLRNAGRSKRKTPPSAWKHNNDQIFQWKQTMKILAFLCFTQSAVEHMKQPWTTPRAVRGSNTWSPSTCKSCDSVIFCANGALSGHRASPGSTTRLSYPAPPWPTLTTNPCPHLSKRWLAPAKKISRPDWHHNPSDSVLSIKIIFWTQNFRGLRRRFGAWMGFGGR